MLSTIALTSLLVKEAPCEGSPSGATRLAWRDGRLGDSALASYNPDVTYTFGLDTSPHSTQPRFIKADPSGGPNGSW